jgi:hypothetical protein
MKKTDELHHPQSCLNRAHDDEWLFVLLGRDAAAPDTVRFWATRRLEMGKNTIEDPQITEALAWADRVEREHAAVQAVREGRDGNDT